jgi:hypothetical protein
MHELLELIGVPQAGLRERPSAAESCHELNQRCRASDRPLLAVGNVAGAIDLNLLGESLLGLRDASFAGVLCPLGGYEWLGDLVDIPLEILLRVPFVEQGVLLLFRRADWERCGGFPDVAQPLAAFARRLAAFGPIHISTSGIPARPAIEFEPPLLTPAAEAPCRTALADFDSQQIVGVKSAADATAVCAGLWQLHGLLEESHRAAQSIEGLGRRRAGDYWHAIMHRREGDYGNAKYWFRRVGGHPLLDELSRRADRILRDAAETGERWRTRLGSPESWDSLAFVDLCEASATESRSALPSPARRIQWDEMILLLGATCGDAYSEAR